MADINQINKIPPRTQKGLYLRKQDLRRGIELMFFAYRDFTGEADNVLAELGLGRARHRVIYFIGRQPGMTVSDLLSILKITKQSLSRVLSHLVAEGYVHQAQGARDKRQRLLSLTDKGMALEDRLTELQCKRFASAFSACGGEAVAGFQNVLANLINEEERAELQARYSDLFD